MRGLVLPFSSKMLDGASILVTGGTGSFGRKFVRMTLDRFSPRKVIVYSRDEMKQWEMSQEFKGDPRLRFFVGDVRDKDRLQRALDGIDYVIHAAALKIVPAAEYNPFECIKTNVLGAMNVIDCAIDNKVKTVIALSTDKACSPINLYGATKLCSDKLFIAGNAYVGNSPTKFAVVRYGNVMGSRGSIIPLFLQQADAGEISITDERMTRFMITLEQGVELVWFALHDCAGGEIYVKKIPSMKVTDIAKALAPQAKVRITGIRPGEKLHEQMISVEDARTCREFDSHYLILPQIALGDGPLVRANMGSPVSEGFCYSSETNADWLSEADLKTWVSKNYKSNCVSDSDSARALQNDGAAGNTIIAEIDCQIPADGRLREALAHVRACMSCERPDLALLEANKIAQDSGAPPEVLLLKAQLETELMRPFEALRTITKFQQLRPEDVRGSRLLEDLRKLIHSDRILEVS